MTVEQNVPAGSETAGTVPARSQAASDAAGAPRRQVFEAGRAAARLTKSLELAVGECSLSLPQYRLLAFLSGGPERATELAQWLDVSPPSLTALVDGLVQKQLVERVTSEEDRRCVRHVLTEMGSAALSEGDQLIAQRLERLTAPLSRADAKKALEGLALLGEAMEVIRLQKQAENQKVTPPPAVTPATTAKVKKEVAAAT